MERVEVDHARRGRRPIVVVATHDFHLLGRIPGAHMMRLDGGRLLDPTGSLRFPPAQAD